MASTRVYIGRLPYKARERDVEDFFRGFGRIREVLLKSGFGFVEFDDPRDADDAVYSLNGRELCGERVIVEMTKRPPKGRDPFLHVVLAIVSFKSRYGPPAQTPWRCIVHNLSSRISWQVGSFNVFCRFSTWLKSR
ncbi:RRM 1 domain containing protein [Trichuris trichiura]|uniref:RRM 1 domain containing protein n=1 Tax=Trichuris trichiura TaxID=36087 RepID=A0A077YYR6_TRITR|nr:RRM 1 domain containing protein [Trichuris trichiura]